MLELMLIVFVLVTWLPAVVLYAFTNSNGGGSPVLHGDAALAGRFRHVPSVRLHFRPLHKSGHVSESGNRVAQDEQAGERPRKCS